MAPRHAAIRRAVTPLPGSQPRDHFKPINIPGECDGLTLLAALERMVWNVSAAEWQAEFARGRIVNLEQRPVAATQLVRAGQRYQHLFPDVTEPAVNGAVEILHEDEALIVVNKPAPLPMHAGGRYYLNTLQHILNEAYHPQTPHPAHRLDADTTGLVLVARTRTFAGQLQSQFAQGRVEKTYLVRVQGQLPADEFYCDAPISAGAGERCSRTVDFKNGLAARTEFRRLRGLADGTHLLEARPLTGRTNQIRVHLWHLGIPVLGDTMYLPGQQLGRTPAPALGDDPLCLHAARVKFLHPSSLEPVEFAAPLPAWAK
ncbi:MAG: RluA family pseudouridine synthase [Verrucomicrobiota bacterium]